MDYINYAPTEKKIKKINKCWSEKYTSEPSLRSGLCVWFPGSNRVPNRSSTGAPV